MINFVCCTVVVDNCDYTVEELTLRLSPFVPVAMMKVMDGYYPKQRIIKVPSAKHVEEVLYGLHQINDEDRERAKL
jgi:hypothetical protein